MEDFIENKPIDYSYMKVCILGDAKTGKTILSRQIVGQAIPSEYKATNFVQIYEKQVNQQQQEMDDELDYFKVNYTLQLYDYGGTQRSINFGASNSLGADIIILVYDSFRVETVKSLSDNVMDIIKGVCNANVQLMLIGTHVGSKKIQSEDLVEKVNELENKVQKYIPVVFKQFININNLEDIHVVENSIYKILRNMQYRTFIRYTQVQQQLQQFQWSINAYNITEEDIMSQGEIVDKTMIKYNDVQVKQINEQTQRGECKYQNKEYELYNVGIEVKDIDKNLEAYSELFNIFQELLINLSLNHEYILKPTHFCFDKKDMKKNVIGNENLLEFNILMIFNQIPYTFKEVSELMGKGAQLQKIEFMIKLGEALIYCHRKNIVHLDLKPSNVLAKKNDYQQYIPQLIDFGISKVVKSGQTHITNNKTTSIILGQTFKYSSPEQQETLGQQMYQDEFISITKKSDVYSYCLLLMEMLTKQPPWPKHGSSVTVNDKKTLFKQEHQQIMSRITIKEIADLIYEGTQPHPKDRPNLDSIVKRLQLIANELIIMNR